ncbi:hypothetical protein BO86DRAFT_379089 [Aspergillus japonicus CBS 114.51]|uniref:Actin-like ATPase domain-containing protein n=1 Tax=Aspergillus japonicus CBS 114.51 TaxID=1448312 RepID=A0A8T8X200_ASPJA|nr:hypothetical protein BO86DRAFT_379089 [Aspergillus japonicus CBS 114.51]RAH82116.1 hypothetical protein BO86DRAFT_379089 [Aspergillus japonicus CBS 114.51]
MEAARLAVGIDFGSSKTVVSYQESSSAHLSPHRLWLHESPIIPSTIAYISDDKCYIGKAAQRCSNCIYWLKHLLHESCKIDDSGDTPIQDLVRMVRNGLPQRQRDNPYILVADFLRVLLHHLRAELECILNLKNLPRVYTFTVPATWSEHTRMMMRKAIQLAGFEHRNATVCFTTEAEAVAMYAATERGIHMRLFSELYDGVIVCDCGASTIATSKDLTAFLVDQPPPSFGYQRLTAYTTCEGQNQLATIFNQNSSFNDGSYKEVFMDVPRTHDGDARIMIIASNTPVSLNQVDGLVVGTIESKTSRMPTNLTPIPLVVECQATVRFEKDHLPPERVLGLAVYYGEAFDKRLVGHMRVLM